MGEALNVAAVTHFYWLKPFQWLGLVVWNERSIFTYPETLKTLLGDGMRRALVKRRQPG